MHAVSEGLGKWLRALGKNILLLATGQLALPPLPALALRERHRVNVNVRGTAVDSVSGRQAHLGTIVYWI